MNFQCLIEYRESSRYFVQFCWLPAGTVGEAIEKIKKDAFSKGYFDLIVREMEPCESGVLPEGYLEPAGGMDTGLRYFRERFEFEHESTFQLPQGIILKGGSTEYPEEEEGIMPGFHRCCLSDGTDRLFINVDEPNMRTLVYALVLMLDEVGYCRFTVSGQWDYQQLDRIWQNDNIVDKQWLKALLVECDKETIANGFLAIAFGDDQTRITVSDHKTLEIKSSCKHFIQATMFLCRRLGMDATPGSQTSDSLVLTSELPHYHYIDQSAMTNENFYALLRERAFYSYFDDKPQRFIS